MEDFRYEQALMLIFEPPVSALSEYLDLTEGQVDWFMDCSYPSFQIESSAVWY